MTDEEIEKLVADFVRVATMALAPQLTSEHGPLTAKQLPEAQSRLRRGVEVALRSIASSARAGALEEAAKKLEALADEVNPAAYEAAYVGSAYRKGAKVIRALLSGS